MKSLFVSIFSVLVGVVHADPYTLPPAYHSALPMHEIVTIYEMPLYPDSEIVYVREHYPSGRTATPMLYTATKPTERVPMEQGVAIPPPLEPLPRFTPSSLSSPAADLLAPRLPPQMEDQGTATVLGQNRSVNELAGLLGSPPPLAKGAVEEGTIDSKLMETVDSAELEADGLMTSVGQGQTPTTPAGLETKLADPLGHTVLLLVTAITTIGLLYMAFVAYDYRQRWMQSLMMQNDRYLVGGAFDMEKTEDTNGPYGGSPLFSEGFGLTRRSI